MFIKFSQMESHYFYVGLVIGVFVHANEALQQWGKTLPPEIPALLGTHEMGHDTKTRFFNTNTAHGVLFILCVW